MGRTIITGLMLALSLLAAGPSAAAPAKGGGKLTVVDLTDDFARVWRETETLPEEAKTAAFRAAFDRSAPGLYPALIGSAPPARQDAAILNALRRYGERREDIEQVSRQFNTMFQPALKGFEREFGPMRGYPTIYLIHSLGSFDGGTRELPGGPHLMFGADMIAQIHKGENVVPFFHHELFHLYHEARIGRCPTGWCRLWTEGLATYVAAKLNPGASDRDLLLTIPEPLRPAVAAHRKAAVCAVVQRLDATSRADLSPLFSSARLSPDLPPRFGYALGYEVAIALGRTRTLRELGDLSQAEARPLVEAALRDMADCAAP